MEKIFSFVVFIVVFVSVFTNTASAQNDSQALVGTGSTLVGSVAVNRMQMCLDACHTAQRTDWLTGICRGNGVEQCMNLEPCRGLMGYLTGAAIARAFAEVCQAPIVTPPATSPQGASAPAATTAATSRRPSSRFTHHSDCQATCQRLTGAALAACTAACRDRNCVRWQSVENLRDADGDLVHGMCIGDRAGLIRQVDGIAGTARHANEIAERALSTTSSFESRLVAVEGRANDAERIARIARCEVNREAVFANGRADISEFNATVAQIRGEIAQYCSGLHRNSGRCNEVVATLHQVQERRINELRAIENQSAQDIAALHCVDLEQQSTPAVPPATPGAVSSTATAPIAPDIGY